MSKQSTKMPTLSNSVDSNKPVIRKLGGCVSVLHFVLPSCFLMVLFDALRSGLHRNGIGFFFLSKHFSMKCCSIARKLRILTAPRSELFMFYF